MHIVCLWIEKYLCSTLSIENIYKKVLVRFLGDSAMYPLDGMIFLWH